ncbi:MAG: hypothetical protein KBE42_08650 [Steroidobacteraceae bacterium]|nr:hypothetical protein [Steroidobacteraceae bacterium]
MNTGSQNERFEADDPVDRAWHGTSVEEPPPQIDAAIIEAARTEAARARQVTPTGTAARVRRNGEWWLRWQPLAAAAAVAGLAFVLVQTIPRDRDVTPPLSHERARPRAPVAPPRAERDAMPAAPIAPPRAEQDATSAAPVESQAEMPSATVQAPVAGKDRSEAYENQARSSAKGAAESVEGRGAETFPAADRWAAKIEALAEAGEYAAAARELRAFRDAYGREEADRELSEELRAWASSVE